MSPADLHARYEALLLAIDVADVVNLSPAAWVRIEEEVRAVCLELLALWEAPETQASSSRPRGSAPTEESSAVQERAGSEQVPSCVHLRVRNGG